jgi:hypothetical protein
MNNQNRIGVGCRGGELGSNPDTQSYLVYSEVFIDVNRYDRNLLSYLGIRFAVGRSERAGRRSVESL